MYGVPKDLDLSGFVGATLIQVCLGESQIQFHFHPKGSFLVEGSWELVDTAGNPVDKVQDHSDRDEYRVHRLLGQAVIAWAIDSPSSLSLTFRNGLTLRLYDDSEQYESFSIQPGDIIV